MPEASKKEEEKASSSEAPSQTPIIIKKIKKGGGHHGGAWKVAYADFVTAMMAFFLLLWLLNVTTDEQKNAISNYFDPTHPKVSQSQSGAGGVLGGLTMSPQGAMTSMQQRAVTSDQNTGSAASSAAQKSYDGTQQKSKPAPTKQERKEIAIAKAKKTVREKEESEFEATKKLIEQAIQENPELNKLAENLIVDMTPEGLRIQVVDSEGRAMFASGSARMYDETKSLMAMVSKIVEKLPNEISVRGHTDSVPYGTGANYTNWELSSDRANAARRIILSSGLEASRINNVVGKADTKHLLPEDPNNARNRRISIVLLKEEITNPEAFAKKANDMAADEIEAIENGDASDDIREGDYETENLEELTHPPRQVPIGTFRKTPGNVQFP